jgi:cytoskeletal protein RodZ
MRQIISDPREWTMSEQAVEERRGWASDIVWVVLYSILILLVMLLWVDVPA